MKKEGHLIYVYSDNESMGSCPACGHDKFDRREQMGITGKQCASLVCQACAAELWREKDRANFMGQYR